MAYVPLATFKDAHDITETARDAEYTRLLDAASAAVDRWCRVEPGHFAPTTATRYFDVTTGDAKRQALAIPPLVSLTTLKTDENSDGTFEVTWTVTTDYLLYPLNATAKTEIQRVGITGRYSFPVGQRTVQIVGEWGEYTSTPMDIEEAVMLQANRWRFRSRSPEGVAGNAEVGFVKLASIDPDVAAILKHGRWRRPEVFA